MTEKAVFPESNYVYVNAGKFTDGSWQGKGGFKTP